MLTETVAYDCFTAAIDTSAESSDSEEFMPSTPKINTAEQIERLYNRLRFMREDLDRLHQERGLDDDDEFGDDECMVMAQEQYWDNGEHSYLDETFPFRREHGISRSLGLELEESVEVNPVASSPACVIWRMPPEILIYVFELVLEADAGSGDDAAEFGGPTGWMKPIILSHVCQFWRVVVLSTSSLWSSFSLVVQRPPVSVDGLNASLDLWLRGSRLTEVAINLEVDPACTGILDGEVMDQLIEMLKRCWRFRVNVSHEMFYGILNLQLPRLRTLEVRTSWLAGDIRGSTIQAPKLQELAILGPTMVTFAKDVLPWAQLRKYRGTCWADIQRHLEIVKLSPNLERCILYPFYEMKGSTTTIRLAHLRHLHLVSFLGTSIDGFLRYLELPVLEYLKLEIPEESPAYGRSVWPKTGVLDLLERSGARLKHLELIGMEGVDG